METSFFSACVSTHPGVKSQGWCASSLEWWEGARGKHDLFISAEVIRELSAESFRNRDAALRMLRGLAVLDLSEEVYGLAEHLVAEKVMPGPAVSGDAVHLAVAILARMDYILSWNVKHLANERKMTHLGVICLRLGFAVPRIVTPDLLQE